MRRALALAVSAALSSAPALGAESDAGAAPDAETPDAGTAADAGAPAPGRPEPAPEPEPEPQPEPTPKPAHAPTKSDRATAKRYFEAGNQAYEAGQYLLAARAYEEAYGLAPLPAIAFSIAQAYRLQYYQDHKLAHLRRALALYHQYLDQAPHGNRRGHATTNIEAIESLLGPATPDPTAKEKPATTKPPPEATQLMVVSHTPHASARIDGSEAMDVPFARGVEPGTRQVQVSAPGYATATSEWLAVASRLVVASIDLQPLPATIHVAAPHGATVRIDGREVAEKRVVVPAGSHVVTLTERGHLPAVRRLDVGRGQSTDVNVPKLDVTDQRVAATWTLIGAGTLAVAGGVTTVLAIRAENNVRRYDDGIGSRIYTRGDLDQRNDAVTAFDRFRTASWVLFGSAAALGVTGGLLWWLDEPGRETAAVKRFTPVVGPATAGGVWRTAF